MTATGISVVAGEYRATALRNGRPVAHAIRTQYGWHVPLGRRGDGMRQWASYNNRDRAIQALAAVAHRGTASAHPPD